MVAQGGLRTVGHSPIRSQGKHSFPLRLPAVTRAPSTPTPLRIVQSDRIETLLQRAAAEAAKAQAAQPLQPQRWLVASHGMAQWVQQALAQRDGVCAGLECLLPAQWLWQTYRAVLGEAEVPDEAPLDRGPLRWRLWRLLPTLAQRADAAVHAPLIHYLDDGDPLRRAQLARRVADLFDQYQIYRPDWLADWAAGHDRLRDADGRVRELPDDERWQPALWRLLRVDAEAQGHRWASRCDIHAAWLRRMADARACPLPAREPPRLTVFGVSALTPDVLQALQAVARWRDVAVYVLNPARTDWFDRDGARTGHPLLAAWGRQGREFIAGLQALAAEEPPAGLAPATLEDAWDDEPADEAAAPHLLAQLQDDLRHGRAPGERDWPPLDPARDGSLRLHVAHTMLREVELLHDQVLAALQRDPTLQPRDIAVFAPDIAAYAPLVHAVWGSLPPDDPRRIPYQLADVEDDTTARLRELLRALLHPEALRLSGSEALDWLDIPAVARAFGLASNDLDTLRAWRREAAIRWGLDGAHRQRLGLATDGGALAERYTWREGLQRLWLGAVLGAEDEPWQDRLLPARGVAVLQTERLHRLQTFIDAVATWTERLAEPTHAAAWGPRLHALLAQFLQPATDDVEGTLAVARLRAAVERWARQAEQAGTEPIPAAVVADTWLALAGGGGAPARFLGGGVTFATLLPMRAVPFRRIHLLGLHDGNFPRRPQGDTHDMMAAVPRPGDRLRRHEDLYLLLEAVLSAREHLGISWLGRHPVDDTERQPALPVAQLRHHLNRQWRLAPGLQGDVAAALTRAHPLHPFDPANFSAAPVADGAAPPLAGAFSYAREWLATGGAAPNPATLRAAPAIPSRPDEPIPVTVAALAELLHDPARAYARQRLGLALPRDDEADDDAEPFAPDRLQQWRTRLAWVEAVVDAALAGADDAATQAAARRARRRAELAGDWPAGAAGAWLARDWDEAIRRVWQHARELAARHPHPVAERARLETTLALPDGPTLAIRDVLPALRRGDDGALARLVTLGSALVEGKKLDAKTYALHRLLRPWVEHVALNVALGPVTSWIATPLGVGRMQPLEPQTVTAVWTTLGQAWHAGLHGPAPLPLPRHAAAAYWGRLHGKDADPAAAWEAARKAYESDHGQAKEPLWRRHYPTFEALAGPREAHADGPFAHWTQALLAPLHAHLARDHDDRNAAAKETAA